MVTSRGIGSSRISTPLAENKEADDDGAVSFHHIVRQNLPSTPVKGLHSPLQSLGGASQAFRNQLCSILRGCRRVCRKRTCLDQHGVLFHCFEHAKSGIASSRRPFVPP